jgi:hypothetical protein
MSEHDRNLATEIYNELTSEASLDEALSSWQFPFYPNKPGDRLRMRFALQAATAVAINKVLTRRLCEAARCGPWGETVEMVEPLTGDTKIIDKFTGRIVATRRYEEEDAPPLAGTGSLDLPRLPRKRTP